MQSATSKRTLLAATVFALAACGGGGGGGGGAQTPPPAQNTPPSFTSPTSFSFGENAAVDFVLTVTDPDSSTVTITDNAGGDGGLFTVDVDSGRVTANTANGAFDFEDPQDTDGDSVYQQEVTLSDGQNTVTRTITVTITDVDEAPEFSNPEQVTLNENETGTILTFTAVDPETGIVASDYAISTVLKVGEVVNAPRLLDAFSVDATTGELSVVVPFDAEIEGTRDAIVVEVQASDGSLVSSGSVSIQLVDLEARVVSGVQLQGRDPVNRLGEYAEEVGDIDQDGLMDFWVGDSTDESGVETAYLIWGRTIAEEMLDGFGDGTIDALSADQAIRFTNDDRSLTARRTLMTAVSAGDVDGDGQPDLLVGLRERRDAASVADVEAGPLAVVLWGDRLQALSSGLVDLPSLTAADGIAIDGLSRQENLRLAVASGDLDNDGRSDLVFGHAARNQVRVLFGEALSRGDTAFDIGAATPGEVVVIQSVTDANVIQQIGIDVELLADLDEDDRPELVISGAGLAPNLQDGVYIVTSPVLAAAIGTSGFVNLLAPATAGQVVEMLIPDAAIVSVSTAGDVDDDGLNDLALAHTGNADNPLVATLVFGATVEKALETETDPSLVFTTPADGINVLVTGQTFTQATDASVSARIVPDLAGDVGAELLIGLGDASTLGRGESGSVTILTDTAIRAASSATLSYPVGQLPASLGRTFVGPTANARIGGQAFIADIDGDGRPDLSMASTTAGPAANGNANGAYLFLPGTDLDAAFGAAGAQIDLAGALNSEVP